jgi:thiamine-phosphate pyrophosphorylase
VPEFHLPRLYPILDVSCFPDHRNLFAAGEALVAAGCTLLQYRNKVGTSREMLSDARELRRRVGYKVRLIMNDRADLALAAGFDGVHVGQDDLSVDAVRRVVGNDFIVGASTHNPEQLRVADRSDANYLAIGPVFATLSKKNPDPVVGLEGVRTARAITSKPLVCIGGITLENCRSVIDAGGDSVAVISSLVRQPLKTGEQFLQLLL